MFCTGFCIHDMERFIKSERSQSQQVSQVMTCETCKTNRTAWTLCLRRRGQLGQLTA